MDPSPSPSPSPSPKQRISLNIGGTHFETTVSTLSPIPTSLLSSPTQPIFLDRDPHLFSPLLSLLRTHNLPFSSSSPPQADHLLRESLFYNLHSLLSSSLSPPPLLPFDSSLSLSLSPPSLPFISSLSTSPLHPSLLLAHSGLISSYNTLTLLRSSTIPTHLHPISSLSHFSTSIAALGSTSSPGLHLYNTLSAEHMGLILWWDPSDPRTHKARVTAIGVDSAGDSVFASFECGHGENAVLVVDKTSLRTVAEFGRQPGNAAKSAAPRKLTWVSEVGLLVGSSVNCGAFGFSGVVRVWDPRVGDRVVWETSEPGGVTRTSRIGDTMADVDVDVEGLFIAKVGSRSGDLGVADMRMLGEDPWVYLEDPNPGLNGGGVGGKSVVVHCYKKHVFVGKDGGLEAWSRVEGRQVSGDCGEGRDWGVYRRNYVDKVEDAERGLIWKIQGGGNRLYVCRENVEGVEVWETSNSSGVKTISL